MARCALLNSKTWEIDNVIMAGPNDSPPDGYVMVVIPDDIPAGIGWKFATGVGFVSPVDAELVDIKQAEIVDKPNKQEILQARADAEAAAVAERDKLVAEATALEQASIDAPVKVDLPEALPTKEPLNQAVVVDPVVEDAKP